MKSIDEPTTEERRLEDRICADLDRQDIPYKRGVSCHFGCIDILILTNPPMIIEVKGRCSSSSVHYAIGQLLSYREDYGNAIMYLAFPAQEYIYSEMRPLLAKLQINLWPPPCDVCEHHAIDRINESLRQGLAPSVVSVHFRISKGLIMAHLGHNISPTEALWGRRNGDGLIDNCSEPCIVDEESCLCYWCMMSGYQRLLRAWQEANDLEKQQFCVDTRHYDVPF